MLVCVPFFKVIVVSVDIFESSIIDERHFSNRPEAESFANEYRCSGGTGYCTSDVITLFKTLYISRCCPVPG